MAGEAGQCRRWTGVIARGFALPGTPSSLLSPSTKRGDGAPQGASVFVLPRSPFGECGRLSALHRGFAPPAEARDTGSGLPALPGLWTGPAGLGVTAFGQVTLWRSDNHWLIPSPARHRSQSGRNAPRAGLPSRPGTFVPAPAASHPANMMPHEGALGGSNEVTYNPKKE
jgi:hypothetical protein